MIRMIIGMTIGTGAFVMYVEVDVWIIDLGTWIGEACISVKHLERQTGDKGFYYEYIDSTNIKDLAWGSGIEISEWFGIEAGFQTPGDYAWDAQCTPWIHGGMQIGMSGISITIGIVNKDTSLDYTIRAGRITIIGIAVISTAPVWAPVLLSWLENPGLNQPVPQK